MGLRYVKLASRLFNFFMLNSSELEIYYAYADVIFIIYLIIVGILTIFSMISIPAESLKTRKVSFLAHLSKI